MMGIGTMQWGAMKTCHAAPAAVPGAGRGLKLLDRLREGLRARHRSRRTEQTYIMWVRRGLRREGGQEPGRNAAGRRMPKKLLQRTRTSRAAEEHR